MRIDAGKATPRDRRKLVELAVRRASPFPDPDFGVAWDADGQGAVWYWSRSRVGSLMAERGESSQRASFVPEALYVRGNDGSEDGLELLQLDDGFCGRCWRSGRLLNERWWPNMPVPSAWHTFLRASGVQGSAQALSVPEPLQVPLRSTPWSATTRRVPALAGISTLDAYLPRVAIGLGLVIVTSAAMQIGSIGRNSFDAWRAGRAGESLDQPLKRILAAREASDRNTAAIKDLLALRPAPASLTLIGEAMRLIPGEGWTIRQWNQPVPDRVEVTVALPSADPTALVASWEASPLFTNATADVLGRSGDVTIRANVVTDEPATPP